MNSEQWKRVEAIRSRAVELSADERETYVREAAAGDEEVATEVLRLLASGPPPTAFLAPPTTEPVPGSPLDLSGRRLGEYLLQEELGRGGMGVVYRAIQTPLGRPVAIKVLPTETGTRSREERFQREARAASRLEHPGIARVYSLGASEETGVCYYAMELVQGKSLRALLDGRTEPPSRHAGGTGALDLATHVGCAATVRHVALALQYAHDRGVVHRDVNPRNLLIEADGNPRLIDFGLAKLVDLSPLTRPGDTAGTPSYMSPEQALAAGIRIDHRTDVYSLGAVLYELLTGHPPFEGGSTAEILRKVANEDPVPLRRLNPSIPEALETICLKTLAKAPSDRFPTALALAEDLQRFERGLEIVTRPESSWSRLRRRLRRRKAEVTVQALGVTLAAVLVTWGKIELDRGLAGKGRLDIDVRAEDGAELSVLRREGLPWEYREVAGSPFAPRGSHHLRLDPGAYRILLREPSGALVELTRGLEAGGTERVQLSPTRFDPAEITRTMLRVPAGNVRVSTGAPGPGGERIPWLENVPYAAFWIDPDLVTNREFLAYLEQVRPPEELEAWREYHDRLREYRPENWLDLPASMVTLDQARGYAEWVGKRLPTLPEWLAALEASHPLELVERARGGAFSLGGEEMLWVSRPGEEGAQLSTLAAYYRYVEAAEPPSPPDRLVDAVGALVEWLDHPSLEVEGGEFVPSSRFQMIVGTAWHTPREHLTVDDLEATMMMPRGMASHDLGFRCVLTDPGLP